jgi:hypothetical protein
VQGKSARETAVKEKAAREKKSADAAFDGQQWWKGGGRDN